MSGMERPVFSTTMASVSTRGIPSRSARAAPTQDFPLPGMPMSTTLVFRTVPVPLRSISSCCRRRLMAMMVWNSSFTSSSCRMSTARLARLASTPALPLPVQHLHPVGQLVLPYLASDLHPPEEEPDQLFVQLVDLLSVLFQIAHIASLSLSKSVISPSAGRQPGRRRPRSRAAPDAGYRGRAGR